MIPSMGGREMGPAFNRFIEVMPYGLDVVEVGAWLGAGTYELATAMKEHGHSASTLHVYDWFIASRQCVGKAAGRHRYRDGVAVDDLGKPIKLKVGQDTLPMVRRFLFDFPFIRFYKGDINKLKYNGKPIGVLVVDAAKREKSFVPMMAKLEPHLAPGAVVFFMDYYFHLYKRRAGTECQAAYVKASGKYTHLESHKNLCCAVFRYE
jgi:hypothetical protein